MMTALVPIALGGMLITGGLVLLGLQLRPAPPQLSASLAQLVAKPPDSGESRASSSAADGVRSGQAQRRWLSRLLPAGVRDGAARYLGAGDADLEILELDRAALLGRALLGGLAGLILPALAAALLAVVGHVSPAAPALIALFLAVFGWLLPGYLARQHAARRRGELVEVLPDFVTLVLLRRGVGAAPEQAMKDACRGRQAWMLRLMYAEIQRAQLANTAAWDGLHRLGERLGVAELRDFADTMSSAGDGAAVVSTLQAAVTSLRHARLTRDQAVAKKRTEQLVAPGLLLLAGYIAMLFIPALMRVFG
jgi:Flp pilus assembly protein TadB